MTILPFPLGQYFVRQQSFMATSWVWARRGDKLSWSFSPVDENLPVQLGGKRILIFISLMYLSKSDCRRYSVRKYDERGHYIESMYTLTTKFDKLVWFSKYFLTLYSMPGLLTHDESK